MRGPHRRPRGAQRHVAGGRDEQACPHRAARRLRGTALGPPSAGVAPPPVCWDLPGSLEAERPHAHPRDGVAAVCPAGRYGLLGPDAPRRPRLLPSRQYLAHAAHAFADRPSSRPPSPRTRPARAGGAQVVRTEALHAHAPPRAGGKPRCEQRRERPHAPRRGGVEGVAAWKAWLITQTTAAGNQPHGQEEAQHGGGARRVGPHHPEQEARCGGGPAGVRRRRGAEWVVAVGRGRSASQGLAILGACERDQKDGSHHVARVVVPGGSPSLAARTRGAVQRR